MFTLGLWEEFIFEKLQNPFFEGVLEPYHVLIAVFISCFTIPIDIILLPIEIITLIIYKILIKKSED